MTFTIVTGPDIGSASLDGSIITYSIDESQIHNSYQTSLTWVANDGANDSNIATLTFNVDLTLGGYIVSINEYEPDAYIDNFNSGLRTEQVSYLGAANTGSTGFFIGNRAGGVNLKVYERDFDRFDYWKNDYSLELNFDETSLAWDYLSETINGFVPFAAYLHVNATGERIQLFSGYWDDNNNGIWDSFRDADPVYGYTSYEPIYLFAPQDLNFPYDPSKIGIYTADNALVTSGGIGWSDQSANWTTPSGEKVIYPIVTALMFTDASTNGAFSVIHPTAVNQSALNTGYTTGSAIYFKTEDPSSRIIADTPIQIPLRPGFNYIEK